VMKVSGASTYTGAVTVNAGTLAVEMRQAWAPRLVA